VVTPGGTQTRTHSPSNELISINGSSLVYDNNGNLTDDGTNLYSYDEENRLVKVAAKSGGTALGQYQYDASDKRISKIDNFGVRTLYYYDGWRTIEEQSAAGVTQATYVFGNYLDEALTMDRVSEPGPFYYHQNAQWSAFALSDSTGKGVEGYSYDAYGFQTVYLPGSDGILWTADDDVLPGAKSAYGNPFLFTEQRYDPESGLDYYKRRHYSSGLGRFTGRDPLGYEAGMNLYAYVQDKPVNLLDALGLCYCDKPMPDESCTYELDGARRLVTHNDSCDLSWYNIFPLGFCCGQDCWSTQWWRCLKVYGSYKWVKQATPASTDTCGIT
jgi:RHS repeat-associated protein